MKSSITPDFKLPWVVTTQYYVFRPVRGRIVIKRKNARSWKIVLRRGRREIYLEKLHEHHIELMRRVLWFKTLQPILNRHTDPAYPLEDYIKEALTKKFGEYVMSKWAVRERAKVRHPKKGFMVMRDIEYLGIRGDLWTVYNKKRGNYQLVIKRGFKIIKTLKYIKTTDVAALWQEADPDKILAKYYKPYDFKVPARNSPEDWGDEAELDEEELWGSQEDQ